MNIKTSYGHILKISLPIMVGSAAQNIIVLSDNIFLYHYDTVDFAAIGLIGAFYLIIIAIGYGFSRGGQILIARKYGERDHSAIGSYFQSLVAYELILALLLFLFIQYLSEPFFRSLINDPEILKLCLDYIQLRSYGLFFSFTGVSIIALYNAVTHTRFIVIDTAILTLSNIVLNYVLIFGHWGFSPMGISGAAIASTLSEVIAFIAFIIYMFFDKVNRSFDLLSFKKLELKLFKNSFNISFPMVAQSFLGLGAYFVFFTWIENNSSADLKVSNLIRNVYLILSIPTWGFSTGINTLVSIFIGRQKRQAVLPITHKTNWLNLASTMLISVPVLVFPNIFLYPLYGGSEHDIIAQSQGLLLLLIPILFMFGVGSIYLNGIIGTGHTRKALILQAMATGIYLVFEYFVLKVYKLNLYWAWSGEFIYWGAILLFSFVYLKSKKWHVKSF